MCLATGSLLTVWWKMRCLGPRLQHPLASWLWLPHTCPSASRERGTYIAAGLLSNDIHSILCSVSVPGVAVWYQSLSQKISLSLSLSFSLSLMIPWFGLLSHISSLRLSSGHSGLVLTLRTNDDAAHSSLPSPHSLLADGSICALLRLCF